MIKRTISLAVLAALMLFGLVAEAQARSWRINSDATKKPHFADINAAMSSSDVVDGDTLYLDPGCLITATQNVTKQVTIIGTGYFSNGVVEQATLKCDVYLRAKGCKIEGCCVPDNIIYFGADNVIVERTRAKHFYWISSANYCTVRQCYVTDQILGYGATDTRSAYFTVENSIITSTSSSCMIQDFYLPTIRNNYLRCNNHPVYRITQGIIENNIVMNPSNIENVGTSRIECTWRNNIESKTGEADSQLGSADESLVFALTGTNDQRYRLKEDSPARGAATDGGDCGPFGGLYPYVCSGYPLGMPHFESSTVPTRPQDGQLRVTQKVVLQSE